jgi:hypothetical protein
MSHEGRIAATRDAGSASRSTRRSVLRGAAGLGMAGMAAGALAGRVLPADRERTEATAHDAAAAQAGAQAGVPTGEQAGALTSHDEPIVAHVHDARTGVVDLFIGTRQVRFTDRQLAARLARAAQA